MLILCQFLFQSNAVRPLQICNNFSPQFWTMLKKSCKIRFPNQVTSTSTSTSTPCYHQHLFSGGIVNKDSCQVIFLIRYRDRRDRKDHKEKSYKRDISIYKIMIYDLFPISCIIPRFWCPTIFTVICGLQKETWNRILFAAPRATAEDLWQLRWRAGTSL